MLLSSCNAISSPFILVIDDELPVLNMLKMFLIRKGFKVDTAESGGDGLKKIESKNYTLILTDIMMPDISGEQILEYIKGEKKSLIPVIGMSGTPWMMDQKKFDAILPKPCSMKEILTVINQFIT